jgi:hypothetical protein
MPAPTSSSRRYQCKGELPGHIENGLGFLLKGEKKIFPYPRLITINAYPQRRKRWPPDQLKQWENISFLCGWPNVGA